MVLGVVLGASVKLWRAVGDDQKVGSRELLSPGLQSSLMLERLFRTISGSIGPGGKKLVEKLMIFCGGLSKRVDKQV